DVRKSLYTPGLFQASRTEGSPSDGGAGVLAPMTKYVVPNATRALAVTPEQEVSIVTRKSPTARIALAAVSLVLVLALVPAALAGKPGGSGGGTTSSGSISLVLATDTSGNGSPNWGDNVTYNVSTTAT